MRFHFGLSFRPKTIFKYIGLGFFGLLAFMGIFKVNASTLGYTSIQVNNSNNQSVMFCNANSSKTCPANFPLGGYEELIGRTFLINFDNTTLTNNHDYTFAIEFLVAHDSSDTAFEQESFLIYQTGSSGALNDTTITWSYSTTYDWEEDYYITSYTYQGQFKATSTSTFYTSLRMENNESFFGVAVGNISLTDDSINQEIINANYQNTQNIINNQNSNTQEIKDTINDNLQSCRNSLNLYKYGDYSLNINFYFQDKLLLENFKNNTTYTLSFDINTSVTPFNLSVGYGNSSSYLVDGPSKDFTSNGRHYLTFTTNRSDYANLWIRLPRYRSITQFNAVVSNIMLTEGNMLLPYEPFGQQMCSNKIDNVANSINNTNQSIEELNDTITDETLPDIDDSTFGDLEISSETAISDLITMPITILRALNNNLGNTCSPYTIPFGLTGGSQTLTFPCIHPEEYLGSTIWNYIDLFICFFMVYNIAMLIISSFESITSLEDTFNSLYEPRHADTGYKPKHGGD